MYVLIRSHKQNFLENGVGLFYQRGQAGLHHGACWEHHVLSGSNWGQDHWTAQHTSLPQFQSKQLTSHYVLHVFTTVELFQKMLFFISKDADRNKPKDFAKFLLSPNSEQLQLQISFQPAVNRWAAYIVSNLYVVFIFGIQTVVWPVMSRLTRSPQCRVWARWGTSHWWGRMANFTGRASKENIKTGWWIYPGDRRF